MVKIKLLLANFYLAIRKYFVFVKENIYIFLLGN